MFCRQHRKDYKGVVFKIRLVFDKGLWIFQRPFFLDQVCKDLLTVALHELYDKVEVVDGG